jgi:small subunit ribosomal protein S5
MPRKKTEKPQEKEEPKKDSAEDQEEDSKVENPTEGLATEMGEVKEIEEVLVDEVRKKGSFEKGAWKPRTSLGLKIRNGEVASIDYALDKRINILEPEIVDALLPNLQTDLLMVGQSKGKFGGGQKRIFKQTQKKTQEGNKPKFATFAVVGNGDGYVGVGYGKSKETVPAREKAIRQAKLNIIKIRRGCGDWGCNCGTAHTVPYKVFGRVGSVRITLIPAPKGTGLKVEKECQKILKLAGITDAWSRTDGQTGSKLNLLMACFKALQQLIEIKIGENGIQKLNIVEGALKAQGQ